MIQPFKDDLLAYLSPKPVWSDDRTRHVQESFKHSLGMRVLLSGHVLVLYKGKGDMWKEVARPLQGRLVA